MEVEVEVVQMLQLLDGKAAALGRVGGGDGHRRGKLFYREVVS